MPILSVIVPIYNVAKYIKRCSISLFEQTLEDIEYIFIDDCSPDNSIDILRDVIELYPNRNVQIIKHSYNKGLAAARKTGLFAATGKYIAHCDSDDWVEPNMYEKLVETAETYNADIVACNILLEDSNKSEVVSYPYSIESIENILNPIFFGWIYGAVWNKLIRRDLYISNNIFPIEDINMWEDSVLTLRLRLVSNKTIIINNSFYHYWVGERKSTFFYKNDTKKVDDMIKATIFIEDYFVQNNLINKADLYIARMKLLAKERLLSNPSWNCLNKWKETFSDNDLNVWKFKQYSFFTKLKISLLHYLPNYLAYPFFLIRKKHR